MQFNASGREKTENINPRETLKKKSSGERGEEFFMNVFIYPAGNTERKVMEKHSEREVSVENHFCKYSVKIKGIGGERGRRVSRR